MKQNKNYWLLVWLFLWMPISLLALDDPFEIKHRDGLLWKIEGKSIKTSHIFGTMHSDDTRVMALVDKIKPQITSSSLICTEISFNYQSMSRANDTMYFENGQTLQPIIGESLFQQISRALEVHGFSADKVDHLKPWAVTIILSKPDTGVMVLDMAIYEEALKLEKQVCGLESVTEQVQTFAGMEIDDQVNILKETVDLLPDIPQMYQELIEIYLKRDLADLVEISQRYSIKDKKLMEKFMDRLVNERNVRMLRRMLLHMKHQSAFFAVGALHLPGEKGILNLLETKGYKVTPLY